MKRVLFLMVAILTMALSGQAKEMNQRLGVGPKKPFSFGLESIAVHYWPNADYTITGALGIETTKDMSSFGLQGGIRRLLYGERNMNFFVGGAFGLVSTEIGGENNSGFELSALSGAEFFFEGLENLGINFQMGVGVVSLKSSNSFKTIAQSPVEAGFIFYF